MKQNESFWGDILKKFLTTLVSLVAIALIAGLFVQFSDYEIAEIDLDFFKLRKKTEKTDESNNEIDPNSIQIEEKVDSISPQITSTSEYHKPSRSTELDTRTNPEYNKKTELETHSTSDEITKQEEIVVERDDLNSNSSRQASSVSGIVDFGSGDSVKKFELFSIPNVNSRSTGIISGSNIIILQEKFTGGELWYKISYNNRNGWIKSKFIIVSD